MVVGTRLRRLGALAAAIGLVLTLGGQAHATERGPSGQEPTGPAQPNILTAMAYSFAQPTVMPPHTNDWDCEPSAEHPNPVLLSNGTLVNSYADWAGLSGKLADAGFCVFSVNLGGAEGSPIQTVAPVAETATQLAEFGDRVLAATGAERLDVVGHSQGGMNPRYWIKNLGGEDTIDRLIGLAPSNYGTDLFGLLTLVQRVPLLRDLVGVPFPAFNDQETHSEFLAELNEGGDTVPGVDYTVIQTKYDQVVTPYTNAFLDPAPNVDNVLLQDVCPADKTDHLGITYDPIAGQLVLNALDPANAEPPRCRFVPPILSS
ncbi:lipase [Saccharomonospora sp. CUA-673]|uniref:alpha/beta fold hydrolase n=1 Tax=Saccharomonospora sp. CUA-673 TaxID=1904969 RepID=UPI000967C57E|nr:alpha/beta fold hydrolase [Saccharomonospora sp. CUA-673]OLT38698.1 lipase [Saccharomonospora sp. CUA-673]